jgi:hypothetical protein
MTRKSLEERAVDAALSYVPPATSLDPGPGITPRPVCASPKAALRRCCAAWQRAFDGYMQPIKRKDSTDELFAAMAAATAYCNAMPMLAGADGVRDFLACVAHGILIGAIQREKSSQLLYAAQVALGTIPREPRPLRTVPAQPPPTPLPQNTAS